MRACRTWQRACECVCARDLRGLVFAISVDELLIGVGLGCLMAGSFPRGGGGGVGGGDGGGGGGLGIQDVERAPPGSQDHAHLGQEPAAELVLWKDGRGTQRAFRPREGHDFRSRFQVSFFL